MRIGYYRDTYVRTDDGWRLKTRAMTFIRRSGDHDSRPAARDRQARGRMTDRRPTVEPSSGQQLTAWLDEHDLTPPRGDHSLDAHTRSTPGCSARSTTPAGCGGAGPNRPAGSADP